MTTFTGAPAASADDAFRRTQGSYFSLLGGASGANGVGRYDSGTKGYGIGIRFPNVTIPQGSAVSAAAITFTAYDSQSGTGIRSRLRAQKADNPGQFSDATDFDSRILTAGAVDSSKITSSVAWDDIAAWTSGSTYQSPDIAAVIQEIVNRPGWVSGNAIVIFWDDFDLRQTTDAAYRLVKDYDLSSGTGAPSLGITYTAPVAKSASDSGSGTDTASVVIPPIAKSASDSGTGSDSAAAAVVVANQGSPSVTVPGASSDAWRRIAGSNSFTLNGNGSAVWNSAGNYDGTYKGWGSGLRFAGLAIPQGATILSATVTVKAATQTASIPGRVCRTRFRGQLADNPGVFTDLADFDSRIGTSNNLATNGVDAAKVTAAVDWDISSFWTSGTDYTSPNLASIIQALVNRSGWASGNAVVLFWDDFDQRSDVDGIRFAYDYESGNPPTLAVTYSMAPSDSATATETATAGAVVTPVSASDSATGTDTGALLAKIDPAAGTSSLRTTGSPTMIEDWTGDTQGGVEQNHNAFPDTARIRGGPYDGCFLIAYQKAYTHGGANGGIWYTIVNPDGSTVVAPTVLRHAGGTQYTGTFTAGSPDNPWWSFGDANVDYLSNGEIMVSWFERQVGVSNYTKVWGRWFDCATATWGAATEITGWQSSGSKYGLIYSPVEVPGVGLVAPEYEISDSTSYPTGLQVRAVKSTDWGRTWTALSTVCTGGPPVGQPNCDETCFARFSDGQIVALQRVEPGYDSGNRIRRFVSNDNGSSWSLTGNVLTSANGTGWYGFTNRPKIVIDANDRLWVCARAKYGSDAGNSYHVVFYSDDRGVTWTGPIDPYDGTTRSAGLPDETTRGWCVSGGFDLGADGSVAHVWAEAKTYSAGPPYVPERSRLYYRALTTVTPGSGTDTATGTDTGSVTVSVGTVAKTASDSGSSTDTASGVAVTYRRTAFDTGIGTDSGGGTGATPVAATYTLPLTANFVSARSQTADFVSARSQTADFIASPTS